MGNDKISDSWNKNATELKAFVKENRREIEIIKNMRAGDTLECQIGHYDNANDGKKKERKKVGYTKKDYNVDVMFDKSFSDKPEVLLSFGGVLFEDIGFDGWAVKAVSVSRFGFRMRVEGYSKSIRIFMVNYMACIL